MFIIVLSVTDILGLCITAQKVEYPSKLKTAIVSRQNSLLTPESSQILLLLYRSDNSFDFESVCWFHFWETTELIK